MRGCSSKRFWDAAKIAVAAALLGAQPAVCADPPLDQSVKATFVAKFAPFVEWPEAAFETADSPLYLCVLGNDPVARLIDRAAAGQRDGIRPLVVRHLNRVERNSPCHLLYASPSGEQTVQSALETVEGRPVLTVTDGPAKGMIAFAIENNRVRFDIDERAAAVSGLDISSRLLSLARTVRPRG